MISCSQYDYLEIACLYHFPVKLTLLDGHELSGIACDTGYNALKQECLILEVEGTREYVVTDNLKSLRVTLDNPHFSFVEFKQ
ncbi:Rho-binding antiterminator [Vibrio panuliri]|uniref:Transcriptional antiterminator n=1 Tax=Vibrio panuliri TaxID=1381081 RepID=A0A1Q9HN76_9VIBR|nr:Rho-binding antiterminator [Vibrio panuliri]KAB1457778.1 transcriptional antiterminator [Vibrio panuliri]OLQ85739.1 transcriptional antiterminator [Vibrio panuliri]OLQ92292.1 transcriptional antiterminator [Vibrio panuliri]